jgi:Kef-type K+ transport system membrane component KefB
MAPLGYDFLKFLAAFVLITPVFKRMNVSPVLGFLLAGVILRRTKCVSLFSLITLLCSLKKTYL